MLLWRAKQTEYLPHRLSMSAKSYPSGADLHLGNYLETRLTPKTQSLALTHLCEIAVFKLARLQVTAHTCPPLLGNISPFIQKIPGSALCEFPCNCLNLHKFTYPRKWGIFPLINIFPKNLPPSYSTCCLPPSRLHNLHDACRVWRLLCDWHDSDRLGGLGWWSDSHISPAPKNCLKHLLREMHCGLR